MGRGLLDYLKINRAGPLENTGAVPGLYYSLLYTLPPPHTQGLECRKQSNSVFK